MSRLNEQFLDEIKARLRPSDFIGRTVQLKKAGREYVGLSPFQKEKTPSFYVNDEKGQFFDFSSGKTGDLIDFLMETQRLTFREAVEQLAAAAGLQMPAADPRSAEIEKVRLGLAEWLNTAADWFAAELRRPAGQSARAYLEKRGLPESEWVRFRLGYAPAGRTGLKDYLVTKGARPAELVNTGLLIAPEDGAAPYDRFRERIMFPILDVRGRVISFGGRALDPNARAKYMNGPETEVFHKSRNLYGLSEARKILSAAPTGSDVPLVVVEGYMDVVACHRAGVAACAPMGTALTEEQIVLLWRHHPEPSLCFDGDRAGKAAAARAIDRALPLLRSGFSLRFAHLTGGKDPDDVLRVHGAAALREQLHRATGFCAALFERELAAGPLDTPERRTALKDRLRKAADAIRDAELSKAYRQDLFARHAKLWAASDPSQARFKVKPSLTGAGAPAKAAAERLSIAVPPLHAALALAAIHEPSLIDDAIETVSDHGFGHERLAALAGGLVALRYDGATLSTAALLRRLQALGYGPAELDEIERSAKRAGVAAPFLKATGERQRDLFRRALEMVVQLQALETAIANETRFTELATLKGTRDRMLRQLNGDWASTRPD